MNQFAQFGQSHMPYMTQAMGLCNVFFCLKNDLGAWKLHCGGEGEFCRVENDLPDDWNECCPVAEWQGGALHVSFVAGPTREAGRNGLYRMELGSLNTSRIMDADVGFARWGWLVWGSRRGPLVVRRGGGEVELHVEGLDFLYRVCPDAFAPSRLLITAAVGGVDKSIIYDFHSGGCEVVTFQDQCLYKFAAHPSGDFVYALRGKGDNEDRRIAQSGSVVRVAAPGLIRVAEREAADDSMDCVACFRKHVAAALSFAKEVMGGHGEGSPLDHRVDLAGEIGNAEQHAREMTVPGYAAALRELRHGLEGRRWMAGADDIVVLRKLWKSSMGADCGCGKRSKGGK